MFVGCKREAISGFARDNKCVCICCQGGETNHYKRNRTIPDYLSRQCGQRSWGEPYGQNLWWCFDETLCGCGSEYFAWSQILLYQQSYNKILSLELLGIKHQVITMTFVQIGLYKSIKFAKSIRAESILWNLTQLWFTKHFLYNPCVQFRCCTFSGSLLYDRQMASSHT